MQQGYAVRYAAAGSSYACFQSRGGVAVGIVQSETAPERIHVWPDYESARAWIEARHPDLSRPLPVGIEFYASVVPLDLAEFEPRPSWLRGALFKFPREAGAVESAAEKPAVKAPAPKPAKVVAAQMSLFGD